MIIHNILPLLIIMTVFSSDKFSQKILTCFNEAQLNDLAFQSGFYQRKNRAKFKAFPFLMLCLYACKQVTLYSLDNLLYFLSKEAGIQSSKQGLSNRFNENAVKYLKAVFENLYIALYQDTLSDFSTFTSIRLLDSTTFNLPEQFASTYKVYGGSSSQSAMSIQQEIDILGNHFYPPIFHSGKEHDALHRSHYPLKAGEMIIRDLGYWNMSYFTEVHQSQAYFLTRFKYGTKAIFMKDKAGQFLQIDLETYLKTVVRSNETKVWEWNIYLGKDKIPLRMIIQKLPLHLVEKRLRKKKQKHRKELGKSYRLFNQVNIFISNAPKAKIKTEDIWQLYRVRWQIELLFKTWKSYARIQDCKKMNIHRFEAMLYAKLLWLLLAHRIYIEIQTNIWNKVSINQNAEKEISLLKFTKLFYLQETENMLKTIQKNQVRELKNILQSFEKEALKFIKLETKNKQKSTFEVIINP